MKLLYRASSLEEANEIRLKLETTGIPVMISGENFSGLRIPFFPNYLGVFIYLDEQYDDAIRIMQDPEYIPVSSINIEEFYQLQESGEFRKKVNHGYLIILGLVLKVILITLLILLLVYNI